MLVQAFVNLVQVLKKSILYILAKHFSWPVSACKSEKNEITCRIYMHRTGCFSHKELCNAMMPDALNLLQLQRQAASNSSFHSCHCSDTCLQKKSSSPYFPVPTWGGLEKIGLSSFEWERASQTSFFPTIVSTVSYCAAWPTFMAIVQLWSSNLVPFRNFFCPWRFCLPPSWFALLFLVCLSFFDLPTVTYSMHSSLMQVNELPKSVKKIRNSCFSDIHPEKQTLQSWFAMP